MKNVCVENIGINLTTFLYDGSRKSLYARMDLEVKNTNISGAMVYIEMDANAKLRPKFITNNPKKQSRNGYSTEEKKIIVFFIVSKFPKAGREENHYKK